MSAILADNSLELQSRTAGYLFEIVDGGLDDIPSVRGVDVVIPQKAGRTWQPKVEDNMLVRLHGTVYGDPSPGVTARESYRSRMAALTAIFNLSAEPFPIEVFPDAFGIGGVVDVGDSMVIYVAVLRVTGPPALGDQVRQLDLECHSIADPPRWLSSLGGS